MKSIHPIALLVMLALCAGNEIFAALGHTLQSHEIAELQRHLNIVCDETAQTLEHNQVTTISILLKDGTRASVTPDEYCSFVMTH